MDNTLLFLIGGAFLLVLLLLSVRKPPGGTPQHPENVVSKDLYNAILAQHEMLRVELAAKEQDLRESHAQLAARDQTLLHLEQTLRVQKSEAERLQTLFKTEFENIANRLLEEKSQRFSEHSTRQLQTVLGPLREKIKDFEENIDRKFLEETREKTSLRHEIEHMRDLNRQLSLDANNLASALKGQNKMQGNWGELQLEVLLEKAGLTRDIHFTAQSTLRDDDGAAKRPDFIIQLPENRHLIIDAKVSLTAFERFYNESDPEQREQHLKAHVTSIRSHIDNLSKTKYQTLRTVNTPDYLLLFIPLENALTLAAQYDARLFTDALDRNIVLVSTGSLLATMRTVAFLWRQEKQTRSVQEIARQSGFLYDKFVAFVEDLKNIGQKLDGARTAYDEAMHKLTTAARPGDTLIGKAEKIRELGAKTTKTLPQELIDADV
jgi:DNA recombination protein RmuC